MKNWLRVLALVALFSLAGCFRASNDMFTPVVASQNQDALPQITRTPLAEISAPNADGMTVLDVNTTDGDADDLRFFMFPDAFVLLVADDHHVQIGALTLVDNRGGHYDFAALFPVVETVAGVLPRDSCFIIAVNLSTIPSVCAGKPIFQAEVAQSFWFDATTNQLRPIQIYGG